MKTFEVPINDRFVGRAKEVAYLKSLNEQNSASIVVVYGRRRIGKTELIEQTYHNRSLIKLEGLENKPRDQQIAHVMYQLSRYLEDPYIAKLQFDTWLSVFDFIADRIDLETWTLYFEELQWLANYEDDFISDFKHAWDNRLRHKKKLIVVLCGSSPSFMINQVLHSKALYNRSTHELHIQELNLKEVQQLFRNKSEREILTAYLTLGGIPEYLLQIKHASSILIGLCAKSFTQDSYFANEHERIFISSMASNPHYRKVINYLSKYRYATRNELAKFLNLHSGGSLTEMLEDLICCGFIEKYTPYQAKQESLLIRYCISDAYLMFYFKFIKPQHMKIIAGIYDNDPIKAIKMDTLQKWMGYSFERMVRRNAHLIAKILGFSGVDYKSGVFFNRATEEKQPGYQIDLIFERADHVYTICEIKYYASLVDANIIEEIERKITLFPNSKKFSIQRVLITTEGISKALFEKHYFDQVIVLKDLFNDKYWL